MGSEGVSLPGLSPPLPPGLFLRLHGLEQWVVFDGVVDGRGGEDGIEAALIRG